jgi:hypothetical protein
MRDCFRTRTLAPFSLALRGGEGLGMRGLSCVVTSQAIVAGATPPTDQFYGERSSKVIDPFGHEWYLGSRVETVSHEKMQRRFTAMFENE